MTLYKHELRRGWKTFLLWTISISCFMAMCVFLFPEMKGEMSKVGSLFSSMGIFTAAFGLDKLNFGTMQGFYAVECGTILSVGGSFYAAIISINILSCEEKEHTAEFLFSHPLARKNILLSKFCALITELAAMDLIVTLVSVLSVAFIGEKFPWKDLSMLHLAYFFCQLELLLICFAISAFSRSNNFGLGLGLTLILYFMSLLANISDQIKVFHWISPFGFAEGSDILVNGHLEWNLIIIGLSVGLICTIAGCIHYLHKDIF